MKSQMFCPWCSCACVVVGSYILDGSCLDITKIHCNRCNRSTSLLGVKL